MTPEQKLAHLERWVKETATAAEAGAGAMNTWQWIVLLFRIEGLLDPGGALRQELDALYVHACSIDEKGNLEKGLRALPGRPRAELLADLASVPTRPRKPLAPTTLQQRNDATTREGSIAAAVALYTPLDVLAHHEVPLALAELLELPLRALDPAFFGGPAPQADAVTAAIDAASLAFPSLRMSAARMDFSSPLQFAVSFNTDLQLQTLDPKGQPAPKPTEGARAAAEPDWRALEAQVLACAKDTLWAWVKKRKGPLRAFLLYSDPPGSYVQVALETATHYRTQRKKLDAAAAKGRRAALGRTDAWLKAKSLLSASAERLYVSGYFSAQEAGLTDFGEQLSEFADSPACPPSPDARGDDYVTAQVRLMLARVVETLVEEKAFDPVRGEGPLAVGIELQDEAPVVLHVLGA